MSSSLPVALSGMVKSFNVAPTTVATGIVMYSMAVAGFVMLGATQSQVDLDSITFCQQRPAASGDGTHNGHARSDC
jgi:hypothetical protein